MTIRSSFNELLARLRGADALETIETEIAERNKALADVAARRETILEEEERAELDGDLAALARCRTELGELGDRERVARAQLPLLEERKREARNVRLMDAIAAAKLENVELYRKLRTKLLEFAELNGQAIELGERWRREFGEAQAAQIPRIHFMGIPLPDLVPLWCADMDQQLNPRPPQPALPKPALRAVPKPIASKPTVKPQRPVAPIVENGTPIIILSSGIELENGYQPSYGQKVIVESAYAERLVKTGKADYAAPEVSHG